MKIDVSIGELVDKVSILAIKLQKITDEAKLANVRKEYDLLLDYMQTAGITATSSDYQELLQVNSRLWDIEDRIRNKEAAKCFDDEFIQLARSVYHENDERAAIKRRINLACGSELVEEKSYSPYSTTT